LKTPFPAILSMIYVKVSGARGSQRSPFCFSSKESCVGPMRQYLDLMRYVTTTVGRKWTVRYRYAVVFSYQMRDLGAAFL
jgi:hypothetical protein